MVRRYTRKTKRALANKEDYERAAKAVLVNGMTVRAAAKDHGLCHVTLSRYIKKVQNGEIASVGWTRHRQVFTDEQEIELVNYLIKSAELHFGLDTLETRVLAYQRAKKYCPEKMPRVWEENGLAGKDWMSAFKKRHPEMSSRIAENLSLGRAMGFNRPAVERFFNSLEDVFNKYPALNATRIYNLDAIRITTVPSEACVIAKKDAQCIGKIVSHDKGTLITIVCAVNAAGNSVPPMFIFPRKKYKDWFIRGAPPHSIGVANVSGWIKGEEFLTYVKHFKHCTNPTAESPVLCVSDSHVSHLHTPAIDYCRQNHIVLLSIPPHSSHKIQPLDKVIYGPFKTYVTDQCHAWMRENNGKPMTIYDIPAIVGTTLPQAMTQAAVITSFRCTGIWPLNKHIFTDADFMAAEVSERDLSPADEGPSNSTAAESSCATDSGLSRKRHQYSIEYKLNAIAKWRDLSENTSQAARHPDVNVDRQTLKGWIMNEESYRVMSNKKVAKRLRKKTDKINNVMKYGDLKNVKKEDVVRFVHPNLPPPSHQSYATRQGTMRRTRNTSAIMSSRNSLIQHDSLSQPSAAKFQKQTGARFENQHFERRIQKSIPHSVQRSLQAHSQLRMMQQRLQVPISPPVPTPPAARKVQVLAPPIQVAAAKPKPVEKPPPQEKRIFVVADHQRCVMSNLASLWKSGKLCDAGIGNGTSTVMVHKLVLSAVCPRLLSVFNADILSHEFLQVNFPGEVSMEALNAFAEYMYNGILDLDRDILEQLKIIAKRLDMKEFMQLCDSHLPNHMHQPSAAASSSFTHIPLIQNSMPIPAMTSSLVSPITTSIQSAPSITTQVIDVKQEITDAELAQVQKDTAAIFGQESTVTSLAPNKSGNAAGFVICPSIKTEPVGPDDNKYGHLSSSSNQVFTSTISSPSSSLATPTAAYTSISSVPTPSTEFSIPFIQSTDVKSTRLKTAPSYETRLVSELSPISCVVKMRHSQSNSMNECVSKRSSQPSDSLFSVDNLTTTFDYTDKAVYPIRLFSAKGNNLPLLKPPLTEAMTVNCLFTK